MHARNSYEQNGFILRRALLPPEVLGRLVGIGERVHAQWLRENLDEARRRDLVNSTQLTGTRYFRPPFEGERAVLFDALASDALTALLVEAFGDDLAFHSTQIFFNPIGGRRRPYWHRDIQYGHGDEARQQALFREFCHLHVRLPLRPEKSFMLVPGSHARWDSELERNVRLELSGHKSWEDLPSATAFDLDPGDVLVFSAHMLHRGTYEGNSARLSFDFMLGRPHPGSSDTSDPDQHPTVAELTGVRNRGWYERAREL